ncbi:uncharacterized protein TRUGW13939_05732 [Talaromyces rugulosus]|uniref:Uncharacterized protein n=1 Tax=Talaromyces rugulosus TaxID=121627 RepID=A0A7H8QXE8_TALRU|nr:uncharacterized protein TRUGW13939_05732 [Talaromyces rugulosus]QKX58607.1 hypothetical protein TRUGW13939_05732 [Talaromyces rugulosus]
MQVSTEIYDLITFYVENIENTGLHFGQEDPRRYNIRGSGSKQMLANLRLVSKAFCMSVSPRLFRHVVAELYSSSRTGHSPLVRLIEISKSRYAIYVRQIDFRFYSYSSGSADRPDVEDLAGILPPCLVRFTNLRALTFDKPPSDLSQEKTRVYIHSVIAAFRDVPLPNLEELEIHFPIAHNFGQFFPLKTSAVQIPITDVIQRLRRLELAVCAYTDHRHQRYWRKPISPEYAALPNEDHASYLFKMIEPAINLTSLSIRGLDIIDLDTVKFSPSLRLRFLTLSCVSISAQNLLSLMVQSRQSLRVIGLELVKLNTETWHHVLLEMSKFPQLVDFHIDSSGYSLTGSSSHFVPGLLPEPDDPSAIETRERHDIPALGNLVRAVNANRVKTGLQPLSDYEYKFARLPPLETQLQDLDLGSGP